MDGKKIGKRLIRLRGERSQTEVAESIQVSASALSMYEAGERIPRDEIKIRIANYFNTTVEAIFFAD